MATTPEVDTGLVKGLGLLDATAIVMCRDHNLPLRVFNLNAAGDLLRVARGEEPGTLVTNG